jgi:hypothetical protein
MRRRQFLAALGTGVQERYTDVDVDEARADSDRTVGGRDTTVTRVDASARLMAVGLSIDVHLSDVRAVEVGASFVVSFAVHPRAFGRQGRLVERLMGAVQPD